MLLKITVEHKCYINLNIIAARSNLTAVPTSMNKVIPILTVVALLSDALYGQSSLQTVIQKGHELGVTCVAVSADSNYIITGSKDKSLKLWEIETGREVRSFLGHEKTVSSVRFSSDNKFVVSGSYDKKAIVWDITSGSQILTYQSESLITDIAIDPQQRFFIVAGYRLHGGGLDSAEVIDFKSGKVLKKLSVNADQGRGHGVSVTISRDGKWVGFGEDNRVANLYNTASWERVHTFEYTEGWCGGCSTFLTISDDSKNLYMISHDGPMKGYELPSGKLIRTYEDKTEDATGIAVSKNGKLVARSTEKDVKVFNTQNGELVATLAAEDKGEFHKIEFLGNSRLVVTSDNNTAFVWNITDQRRERIFSGFLNERDKGGLNYDPNFYWQSAIAKYVRFKNSLLLSKDGKSLIKGKFGTKVKQWDIATGKTVMEFNGHEKAVLAYALSKDGSKLLTGGGDGKIILWDVKSGDSIKVIRSYREPIFDIQFSSDETKILTTSWDATMKIHDLQSGTLLTYFEFENYAAYNILFHPNDLYVVSARLDNSLQLWEPDTRTSIRNFVGHTDIISSIQFSSDGKTLMSASWDGSIRLWDVGTGLMTRKLKGHQGAVYVATFSSDGKYIYSGGGDRQILMWDLESGKSIKSFQGHQAEVTSLLLSPDKKMLISHSVDGVTKFWDLQTGKEFFEHIHIGENDWMAKNPEGYFNTTDNARRYIHFVDGMSTFSVDQFFNDFYRPDLLPQIFRSRGGGGELKGIQGKLKSAPPPTVKVAVLPIEEGVAEIYVRVTDNGAGVDNLKLFHNGKSIPIQTSELQLPSGTGETTTYKHRLNLVGGSNTFTATARNHDNIEADAHSVEMFSDHPSKSSTCHIMAVGINRYKNSKLSLNYAKPDAESFTKMMDERGTSLFKSIELHTLYDDDATKTQILKKLDELSNKIHPEDVFIFYYAGHGSMVDNQFYFIPTESSRLYDQNALSKEAIEAGLLQDKFRHIAALKQLIIMDACQSGGSVELLATRGASEEKAIAQLSRSAGIHVMASAGSEQFAAEFDELGHGLFTYVLMRALQGEADGAPKDGKVTIYELKSFIDDQVPEMTRKLKGKPQYPYTFSRGQDFPVAIE
jgi:WD40 repeat protein